MFFHLYVTLFCGKMERKQGAIRKKSIGSTEKSVHTYVYLNETNHEFGSRSIKLDANADIL